MKVEELLKITSRKVITIKQNITVLAALNVLVENNIGALPVTDNAEKLVGIVSERDLLRECALRCAVIDKTKIMDVMTRDVVIGLPGDDLDYVESVMVQKQIRHLPIIVDGRLGGMVSIRDIIGHQLNEAKAEARLLNDYISSDFPLTKENDFTPL